MSRRIQIAAFALAAGSVLTLFPAPGQATGVPAANLPRIASFVGGTQTVPSSEEPYCC